MSNAAVLHPDFKPEPFWWEAYKPAPGDPADVLKRADVAIIGGGYTGLACGLELSRLGRKAVVLEATVPGIGASTRNGGAVSGGFHIGKTASKKGLRDAQASEALKTSGEMAFTVLDEIIEREGIACHWEKRGRFVGAWNREDHRKQAAAVEAALKAGRTDFRLVSREEQEREVGSPFYHGGLLADRSGKLHPALYFKGLLDAARRSGVTICANAPVSGIRESNGGWIVRTERGEIACRDVVIATNGYTPKVAPQIRRRLIPVASHVLATEELPDDLAAGLLPTGRTGSETQRVLCYFRMSPDGKRLIFGGRARFTEPPVEMIAGILHGFMTARFPQLAGVRLTHCWSGLIAMTFDGLPHTGQIDGMHYAVGCNGSGVGMLTYLGTRTAQRIAGVAADRCGFEEQPFEAPPLYRGDPTFILPAVGAYYRWRDRMSRDAA